MISKNTNLTKLISELIYLRTRPPCSWLKSQLCTSENKQLPPYHNFIIINPLRWKKECLNSAPSVLLPVCLKGGTVCPDRPHTAGSPLPLLSFLLFFFLLSFSISSSSSPLPLSWVLSCYLQCSTSLWTPTVMSVCHLSSPLCFISYPLPPSQCSLSVSPPLRPCSVFSWIVCYCPCWLLIHLPHPSACTHLVSPPPPLSSSLSHVSLCSVSPALTSSSSRYHPHPQTPPP